MKVHTSFKIFWLDLPGHYKSRPKVVMAGMAHVRSHRCLARSPVCSCFWRDFLKRIDIRFCSISTMARKRDLATESSVFRVPDEGGQ